MIELWYPNAVQNWNPNQKVFKSGKMRTRGKYRKGYPEGLIVHYDAGSGSVAAPISTALQKGYAYFTIARDGTVYQNAPVNEWGYHAGRSFFTKLGDNVSTKLAGVEVVSAGLLTPGDGGWSQKLGVWGKFKAWFHKKPAQYFDANQVRYSKGRDNQVRGFYQVFTAAQEKSLVDLAFWLKRNNPEVFKFYNVLGHDEVCVPRGRKQDPGAALSMSMPEFRDMLTDNFTSTVS